MTCGLTGLVVGCDLSALFNVCVGCGLFGLGFLWVFSYGFGYGIVGLLTAVFCLGWNVGLL